MAGNKVATDLEHLRISIRVFRRRVFQAKPIRFRAVYHVFTLRFLRKSLLYDRELVECFAKLPYFVSVFSHLTIQTLSLSISMILSISTQGGSLLFITSIS